MSKKKKKDKKKQDILYNENLARTDMYCSNCSKGFIAELDHSVDGNHILECPHCSHEHCRVIKDGTITGDRWSSRAQRVDVSKRRVWKHNVLQMQTSTASAFIRDRWLNKEY